ncbi:transcriptional regulation of mitochondrial recombination-domain-containing protein [Podospora didyma]|uniref:Large ribosomal subunit protein mL67 n=1 Tax=Podospora didyma TaxID=330526 RepID=A0AAE0K197_9PEZI|nr:transcriptional regulation of mitochondrial recombination-domain-containing protein [Podospora didyma]
MSIAGMFRRARLPAKYRNLGPITHIDAAMSYSLQASMSASASPACRHLVSASFGLLLPRVSRRQAHRRANKRTDEASHPVGHGEKMWVWNHIEEGRILYSLDPILRSSQAIKQMPFTGKKLVPAKIRKDYWRPMAMIEFGPSSTTTTPEAKPEEETAKVHKYREKERKSTELGAVGRSVFQKLRELKKRHELEWENPEFLHLTKHDRGKEINDMKGNSVADIAAVLGGGGKGNRMWFYPNRGDKKKAKTLARLAKKEAAAAALVPAATAANEDRTTTTKDTQTEETEVATTTDAPEELVKELHKATVYWMHEQDRHWAAKWPENVSHVVGLPGFYQKYTTTLRVDGSAPEEELVAEAAAAAAAAAAEPPKDGAIAKYKLRKAT